MEESNSWWAGLLLLLALFIIGYSHEQAARQAREQEIVEVMRKHQTTTQTTQP